MRIFLLLFALAASTACREWEEPVFEATTELRNVMLGDLRSRDYLNGEGEPIFTDDIVIAGRVVSSTRAGNFYNTFFIDDGTGGAEIMAGMYDLDAAFRAGQMVSVRARGLAVGWRDGAMQIGLPPEKGSYYATGYFYHRAVMRPYVTAERDVEAVEPLNVEPNELYEPRSDDLFYGQTLCGRLVRIAGLVADVQAGQTWATSEPIPTPGYIDFYPADGAGEGSAARPLTVVTSGYASFAADAVPLGKVALTGILFYGRADGSRDRFMLKLRDENDVAPL